VEPLASALTAASAFEHHFAAPQSPLCHSQHPQPLLIRQGSGFLSREDGLERLNAFNEAIAEGTMKAAVPNSKAKGDGGDIGAWRNIVTLHQAKRTSIAQLAAMVNKASGASGCPTLSQTVVDSFSDSDSD
jgi:hypothetical protein